MSRARSYNRNGPSRDRSPLRHSDRFTPGDANGPAVHPSRQPSFTHNRDAPTAPPRPFEDAQRGPVPPYPSRGRGFSSTRSDYRGDYRDREFSARDRRESPPSWPVNDRDRTWRPRDSSRTRSPPRSREVRDFRDGDRRDNDFGRARRPSPDRAIPASSYPDSRASGPTPASRGFGRGLTRGRGRGDWEGGFRGRGRGYPDDRELFPHRSRSPRDRRRDVDERPPPARRDDVWPPVREERPRDTERFRDPPQPQPDEPVGRRSSLPSATLSIATNTNLRRTSTVNVPEAARSAGWRADGPSSRVPTQTTQQTPRPSSPPRAPEVPAFGSSQSAPMAEGWNVWKAPTQAEPPRAPAQMLKASAGTPRQDTTRLPPTAPRAERTPLPNVQSTQKDLPSAYPSANPLASQASPARPLPKKASPVPGAPRGPSTQTPSAPSMMRSPPTGPRGAVLPAARRPSIRSDLQAPLASPTVKSPPISPLHPAPPPGPRSSYPPGPPTAATTGIPTGPRNMNTRPSMNMGWQYNRSQPPQQPSSSVPLVPAKRGSNGEQKTDTTAGAHVRQPQGADPENDSSHANAPTTVKHPATDERLPIQGIEEEEEDDDDDDVEEDDMDLDETDFNENEARFEEEKRRLEAKKYDLDTRHLRGATPLEQLGLLGAVGQQDLMVILASRNRHPLEVLNVANGNVTMRDSDEQGAGSSEMPTPKLEEKAQHGRGQGGSLDDQQLQPRSPTPEYDSPPSQSPPPIRTPELQSLPFLNREPLTPLSELDTFSWNVAKYESQKEPAKLQVLRELGAQSQFEDEMGNEYALFYRSWKLHIKELDERAAIEHIDRQRSAEKSVAPEGPEIAPPLPTPTEGTRRSRIYQTEYDLKKIEDESRRTHEEEEAARRKDALEALGPDRTREAEIPEMISDSEARLRMFKDTSCLRDPDNAVVFYQLRPPVDNFTLEEHRIMVENFRDYPKKWGKLTQGLVDRDYKDCINHYYATKWNKEFKLRTVKGSRKKNVRGGRAGGRGRTNALISNLGGAEPDLYGGDETNAPVASVTERGRPRRAAAPSFGDNKNDDTAQTPGKKGSRPVLSTEATAEKVARKQKTGARGVAQRRPRGQPSALKRSASPQKVDPTPETRAPHAADIRGGYPDMSAREDYFSRAMQNPPHTETNRSLLPHQRAGDMTTVQDLYSAPSTMPGSFDPLKGLGQATPKVPPSSYWAVREADNFPDYLKRYGTDWNAISTHMGGGKSATMCKNYFHRLVSQGRTDLEEVAAATDASRNQSGEAGASYAETTVPPRRARGELQTPSLHPRTIAPSVGSDNVVQVEEATAHPHSQPATEPTSRYPTWNGSPQAGGNMLSERRHTRNISSGHRAEPGPVDWVQGTNIGSQHASSRAWATQGQPATLDDTYRQRPLSQAGPSYGDSVVEDRIRLSEDERRRFSAEHRSRYLQGPTRDNPEYYGRSMYPPGPSLHETSQRQLHEQSQYIAPPERSTWQDKRETSTRDAFQGLPADRGASVNQPLSQFHRDSGPAPYRSTASAFSPNQTPTFAPARIQADSRYEPAARMPEPPVRSSQQSTSYGLESTHVRSSSTTGHFDPLRRHAPRVEEESRLQQASPTSGAVPPQPVRTEPPQRKSNIFSVLNDSDDPKPSRSAPTLSARTGTPPQFAPLTAPPRPPSVVERRDLYGELPRPASTSYQPSPLGQPTYGSPPISGREPIRQHEQRPEWMQPQIAQSGSSSTYDRGPLSSSYLHRSSAGSLPSLQAHRSNPSPPPQQFGFGSSSGVRTPKPGHSRDSSFSRPQQSSYPSAAAQYTAPERGSQYGERIQYGAPHSTSQTPQPSYASAYAPPATSSAPQHYGTPSNQQAGSYGAGSGYPPQAPPAQHSEYAAPPRFGDRATFEQQERDRQREAEAVRPQGFGQSRYGENRYGEPRQ